jgi:hypothetical protein
MLTCHESTTEEAAAGLLLGYASCAAVTPGSGTVTAYLPHPTTPAAGLEGGVVKVEGSAGGSTSADEGVSPDVAAAAWLAHLEAGRPVPDSKTLISLLKAMLESRALRPISSGRLDVKLVQIDTGKKFPHMLDTANGTLTEDEAIWTQADKIAPSHPIPRDLQNQELAPATSHTPTPPRARLNIPLLPPTHPSPTTTPPPPFPHHHPTPTLPPPPPHPHPFPPTPHPTATPPPLHPHLPPPHRHPSPPPSPPRAHPTVSPRSARPR